MSQSDTCSGTQARLGAPCGRRRAGGKERTGEGEGEGESESEGEGEGEGEGESARVAATHIARSELLAREDEGAVHAVADEHGALARTAARDTE